MPNFRILSWSSLLGIPLSMSIPTMVAGVVAAAADATGGRGLGRVYTVGAAAR